MPVFAVGSDLQEKQQFKTQQKHQFGLNNDLQGSGDKNQLQNRTKTQDQLQTIDCSGCLGKGDKVLKRLKTQNRLKIQDCT